MCTTTSLTGRAWKYGDNVNTDVIFPGKYTYTLTDPQEIARHALEDLDPDFARGVRPGDVIVGGRNFGCGSSREQAATCLVHSGVGAVIAVSFSRIFYRNAINNGLLAIACPDAVHAIQPGETVVVDVERHVIRCPAGEFPFPPLSESVRRIVEAGGLVRYVKRRLEIEGILPTGGIAGRNVAGNSTADSGMEPRPGTCHRPLVDEALVERGREKGQA